MADADVRDDTEHHRFVLEQDGVTAELIYETAPGKLVLIHTEVPEALGGRGIGGTLVRAAIDRARRDGVGLVPICPFAKRWIEGHPDAVDGIAVTDR